LRSLFFGKNIFLLASVFFVLSAIFAGCEKEIKSAKKTSAPAPDKVSQIAKQIKAGKTPMPVNQVALLDADKERELLQQIKGTKLHVEFTERIAQIRKYQHRFKSAASWLSYEPTIEPRNYIATRYKIAEILYAGDYLSEALALCELRVLPDEVPEKFRQLFEALKEKIIARARAKSARK